MTPDAPPSPDLILDLMAATGLPEGAVKGVCGALAASGRYRQDRAVMLEVATTWGTAFENVELMAAMRLPDIQAVISGAATQAMMIVGMAHTELIRRFNNPAAVAEIKPEKLSTIIKQQFDIADKATASKGPGTVNNIQINGNVGFIRELKELRATEKPARERVLERLGLWQ